MNNPLDPRARELRDGTADNQITNPSAASNVRTFDDVLQANLSRRRFLTSTLVLAGAGSMLAGCSSDDEEAALAAAQKIEPDTAKRFNFVEVEHGTFYDHLCAPDHSAQILIKWGDPLFNDAPEFDVTAQSASTQLQQFGFNCDYVGYVPLEPLPGGGARALLCVNHEYPIPWLMFPGFTGSLEELTAEQVHVTQAAIGCSIVEVYRKRDGWWVDRGSEYNRRISAYDTKMRVSGPAAGHPRLRTIADPSGREVIGTFNNCGGGVTPWGTYLTCEENFNFHFGGALPDEHLEQVNYARYNVPQDYTGWAHKDPRFDLSTEPNEPNRFGWMVEIDPKDPTSTPIKRTALGRFKHECGESRMAHDDRLVVYMGDDQVFEYLYKFVTRDPVDLFQPANNRDLLDHGTLYVAKFLNEGRLEWLPLDISDPRLGAEFATQADLLIETRRAAELLGATPMDRPEDVQPHPTNGKVYVNLTNNTGREKANVANDRVENAFGHIIEISEDCKDAAATGADWQVLVRCGNPDVPEHQASWNAATSANGWFASPDNAAIDPSGRLWVATDQGSKVNLSGTSDGLWALETEGVERGTGKMFYRVPKGAELCGPCFSEDGESLFLAIQHPGDYDRTDDEKAMGGAIDWPEFTMGQPPKPSIVVVTKKAGGRVG